MRMPRRIAGVIAGATFGLAVLTATGAHAADAADTVVAPSTSVVEQDSRALTVDVKATRTKEERQQLRTKEE